MTPRDAIVGGVLPLAIASGGVAIAWHVWRPAGAAHRARAGWGASLGLGLGVGIAYALIESRIPAFPPSQSGDWIPYAALAGAVLGLLFTLLRAPAWVAWPLRAAACISLAPLIVGMLRTPPWGGAAGAILHALVIGAVVLGVWWSIDRLASRRTGPWLPLALVLSVVASAGAMLLLALTARIAQHAGSVGAACAGVALLSLWRRDLPLARGLGGPFALTTASIWLVAHYFTYGSSALVAIACFVAPAAAWAGELPPLRRRAGWAGGLVGVGAVALVLAGALALAGVLGLGGDGAGYAY